MTEPALHPAAGAPPAGARVRSSLWLWVAGAFLVLAIVWTVLFTVAHSAKVEQVPLAPRGGRP